MVFPSDNLSTARSLDVDESGDATITSRCRLVGYHIFSEEVDAAVGGTETYVKFYNKATAAAATDTPVMTIGFDGHSHVTTMLPIPVLFSAGISVRAVDDVGDSDNNGPLQVVSITLFYMSDTAVSE